MARERFAAAAGSARGQTGASYAIPTKDEKLRVLSIERIAAAATQFIEHARSHPDTRFFVTRIGCGLAGYADAQIAPLFADAPPNCSFAEAWRTHLGR